MQKNSYSPRVYTPQTTSLYFAILLSQYYDSGNVLYYLYRFSIYFAVWNWISNIFLRWSTIVKLTYDAMVNKVLILQSIGINTIHVKYICFIDRVWYTEIVWLCNRLAISVPSFNEKSKFKEHKYNAL